MKTPVMQNDLSLYSRLKKRVDMVASLETAVLKEEDGAVIFKRLIRLERILQFYSERANDNHTAQREDACLRTVTVAVSSGCNWGH